MGKIVSALERESALAAGIVVAALNAGVTLGVLNASQSAAIIATIQAVIVLLGAFGVRHIVWSPESVQVLVGKLASARIRQSSAIPPKP